MVTIRITEPERVVGLSSYRHLSEARVATRPPDWRPHQTRGQLVADCVFHLCHPPEVQVIGIGNALQYCNLLGAVIINFTANTCYSFHVQTLRYGCHILIHKLLFMRMK